MRKMETKIGLQELAQLLKVRPTTIFKSYLNGRMAGVGYDKEGNLQFRKDWLIGVCVIKAQC